MKTYCGCNCLVSYGSLFKYTFCRNRKGTTYIRERVKPRRVITEKRINADIKFRNAVILYNKYVKENKEYLKYLNEEKNKLGYCNSYYMFIGNIIEYQKYYTIMEIEAKILNETLEYKRTPNKIKIDNRNRDLTNKCLEKLRKKNINLIIMNEIYNFFNVKDNTESFLELKLSTPPEIIDKLKNVGALI